MKKVFIFFLFVCGIICFGIAGYAYTRLQSVYQIFAYYGVSEKAYLSNEDIAATIFNLKFGIVKFTFCGIAAWVIGFILFIFKRKAIVKK